MVNVRSLIGDKVEEDASCNSVFMVPAMNYVGQAIPNAYLWIDINIKHYLVMNTAWDHGTIDTNQEYQANLINKYKIEIIFQVLCSPYMNILDFGVWCSLHAAVEFIMET